MPDTSDLRVATRRVKKLALEKAEQVLLNPSDPLYNETYLTILKNTVPRTQEITGEDGEAINVTFVNYADSKAPIPTSALSSPSADSV